MGMTRVFIKCNAPEHIGMSNSTICPFCNASHERSFSITRTTDGVLFHCFRAKCTGSSGFIPDLGGLPYVGGRSIPAEVWRGSTIALPWDVQGTLEERYGFHKEDLDNNGVRYIEREDRIYLPIMDRHGEEVGFVSRHLPMKEFESGPKTITKWKDPDYVPKIHYPNQQFVSKDVVLVEDIYSSIRVSEYRSCISLLGTGLSSSVLTAIRSRFSNVYMALDRDATDKALYYMRKLGVGVIPLFKDPKDMDDEELSQTFNI